MEGMEVIETKPMKEQRLVHLDLKGAPPKLNYYEEIFPLLSKWGATGLLVEYEDMFPYWGDLKDLASPHAYSKEEIQKLQDLAKINDLDIIPLVQTFGHFEFVLKHEKFQSLREVPEYPMTLCPTHPDSLTLVSTMIDQIMELHKGIQWLHIGADEVFHVGVCVRCQCHLETNGLSPIGMFFDHVQRVLEYVRDQFPELGRIMWDDVYRGAELDTLTGSGITDLVEPMVWIYTSHFTVPSDMWDRYAKVFSRVWVASAFKGATGPDSFVTDISYHLENNKRWLDIVKNEIRPKFRSFGGFCLTGWQRYDHYSVLCELLPVGLPSLAICLLTITKGSCTQEVYVQASLDLNFNSLIPLEPFKNIGVLFKCKFPSSEIYTDVQALVCLNTEYKALYKNDSLKCWMSPYHVDHRFVNPAHIKNFLPSAESLLAQFTKVHEQLIEGLQRIFYPDAIEEWMDCYVKHKLLKLTSTVEQAKSQLTIGAGPKIYPVSCNND